MWFWAALVATGLASPVKADGEVLWVVTGVESGRAERVRLRVERELGVDVVDVASVRGRLHARLAENSRQPGRRDLTEAARTAYRELRLDESDRVYGELIEACLRDNSVDRQELATYLFERSITRLARRQEADALNDMVTALTIWPGLRVDPDEHGPRAVQLHAQARARLNAQEEGPLSVVVEPHDARVLLDGSVRPSSARTAPTGRHLLTVERTGFEPISRWIDVTAEGQTSVRVVLTEASLELLARQLVNGDPQAVPDYATLAARALGASRIVSLAIEGATLRITVTADGNPPLEHRVNDDADDDEIAAAILGERVNVLV